jgi:hypothetical protein
MGNTLLESKILEETVRTTDYTNNRFIEQYRTNQKE